MASRSLTWTVITLSVKGEGDMTFEITWDDCRRLFEVKAPASYPIYVSGTHLTDALRMLACVKEHEVEKKFPIPGREG